MREEHEEESCEAEDSVAEPRPKRNQLDTPAPKDPEPEPEPEPVSLVTKMWLSIPREEALKIKMPEVIIDPDEPLEISTIENGIALLRRYQRYADINKHEALQIGYQRGILLRKFKDLCKAKKLS